MVYEFVPRSLYRKITDKFMGKSSFLTSSLLSERHAGVCDAAVLVRKCMESYINEQNRHSVPPGWIEAEEQVRNEL